MSLFAVASLSSFSVFSMGIQIWKRTQAGGQSEYKVLIAVEKMGQDLRSFIRAEHKDELMKESFDFEGNNTRMAIPSIVTYVTKDQVEMKQPGRITYQWESGKKELCRISETATDLYRKKTPVCKPLAKGITRFKIRYWIYDTLGKSFSWYDQWELKDGIPAAVRIEMELSPKHKNQTLGKIITRTFLIPVAQTGESFGESDAIEQ